MNAAQWCARLTAGAVVSAVAVLSAGTGAQADPPRGWSGGIEADFGSVRWVHEGWYKGARGNWHVGDLTIEEDDDVLDGGITDWRCPEGAEPPEPLVWPVPETSCTVVGTTYVQQLSPWDVADFDHRTNRLTISGDFPEIDGETLEVIGSVPIHVTIKGLGEPTVTTWQSDDGTVRDHGEDFGGARAWGRFDGHRVSGPDVTQVHASVSFYISGLSRTP